MGRLSLNLTHPIADIFRATYTREYWFGFNYGPQYSWASYASSAGYATLSIDRLGNGQSSHPDPILTVQIPLQVEILHLIIAAARSGNLSLPAPYSGTKFSRIIAVGHSLGSVVVNSLNWRFPADADATILTGFASNLYTLQLLGFLAESSLVPARDLAVGYIEFSNYEDWLWLFYSPGLYDENLANYDWEHRGTAALGEDVTGVLGSQVAEQYVRPVMVITGLHDAVFCSFFTLDLGGLLGLGGTQTCDMGPDGVVGMTQGFYPRARSVDFFYPNAGHCWALQNAAEEGFEAAHGWMSEQGF